MNGSTLVKVVGIIRIIMPPVHRPVFDQPIVEKEQAEG
jgi:hypothetical protein